MERRRKLWPHYSWWVLAPSTQLILAMLLQRSDFTWLAKQNTVCWTHEGKWAKMYFTYRCRQANSWQELEKDWRAVGKNYHHQRWTVRVYGAVLYSLDTLYIAIASVSVLSLPSLYEEHTAQLQMHASHFCLDAASLSFCLLPTMQQQLHSGHCFIARCTSLHEMCAQQRSVSPSAGCLGISQQPASS